MSVHIAMFGRVQSQVDQRSGAKTTLSEMFQDWVALTESEGLRLNSEGVATPCTMTNISLDV